MAAPPAPGSELVAEGLARAALARRHARRRARLHLLALVLFGLGVLAIALLIPVWGGIRYLVYSGVEDAPQARLVLGFILLLAGVGLLAAGWGLDRRSRRREIFQEAYDQARRSRWRAWRRFGGPRPPAGPPADEEAD
jgi:hypothetical protein